MRRSTPLDPWQGHKLRYVHPLTGGSPMPTISACMQLLPAGFKGLALRSTDGTVYNVVEGRGIAIIDGQRFAFGVHDTFVVPSWSTLRFETGEDVVLFSFSDRPVQEAMGIHRELLLDQ
jgi:gentisate 1,2-dioxygenase